MINLDSKIALITGSSDGIGKAAAILFSFLGAKVAIVGRDQTKLDQVAAECEAKSPHHYKPVVIKADFTRDEDVVRTFEETISAYKHLDILVNNAGLGGTKDIRDPDYIHDYDRVQQVNVRSVVRLTELSIPHLVKSKGLIVNVSSVVAVKPSQKFWYYSMSKAALDMFTKTMALKLAPHVRVNSVNPGPVRTRFLSPLVPDTKTVYEDMDKRQPLGRVGDPNEIANAIAFLSSEVSSNMTGSIVFSDSGYLLAE